MSRSPDAPKTRRVRLGRFSLELPGAMVRQGQRYMLGGVRLMEELPAGEVQAGWLEASWEERLARRRPAPGGAAVLELAPGLRGVTFQPSPHNPRYLALEALLDLGDLGLWLRLDGDHEEADALADRIRDLSCKAHPLPLSEGAGLPAARGPGFYLERCMVELPCQHREEAFVRFQDGDEGLSLEVAAELPGSPTPRGLNDGLEEAEPMLQACGQQAETLRAGCRVATGREGEELVLGFSRGAEAEEVFVWRHPGEAGLPADPRLVLVLRTGIRHRDQAARIWDQALASLAWEGTDAR